MGESRLGCDSLVVCSRSSSLLLELTSALAPTVRLIHVGSEAELPELLRTERPRLIAIHLTESHYGQESLGAPQSAPRAGVPIIAIRETLSAISIPSCGVLLPADVLCQSSERWIPLLLGWWHGGEEAKYIVSAMRLLHDCAPKDLLPLIDRLSHTQTRHLSVKGWAALENVDRTTLFRYVKKLGASPSDVLDILCALRVAARLITTGAGGRSSAVDRREARLLRRTLRLDGAELRALRDAGDELAAREIVRQRLRAYFSNILSGESGGGPRGPPPGFPSARQ